MDFFTFRFNSRLFRRWFSEALIASALLRQLETCLLKVKLSANVTPKYFNSLTSLLVLNPRATDRDRRRFQVTGNPPCDSQDPVRPKSEKIRSVERPAGRFGRSNDRSGDSVGRMTGREIRSVKWPIGFSFVKISQWTPNSGMAVPGDSCLTGLYWFTCEFKRGNDLGSERTIELFGCLNNAWMKQSVIFDFNICLLHSSRSNKNKLAFNF